MNLSQPLADAYGAAMKSHVGLASTYYEGVRRIRQSQIDQINAADDECRRYLQQMEGVSDLDTLQTLHAQIVSEQAERIGSYWNNVSRDLNTLHLELSSLMQDFGARLVQGLRQQMEQLQSELSRSASALHLPVQDATESAGYSDNGRAARSRPAKQASAH